MVVCMVDSELKDPPNQPPYQPSPPSYNLHLVSRSPSIWCSLPSFWQRIKLWGEGSLNVLFLIPLLILNNKRYYITKISRIDYNNSINVLPISTRIYILKSWEINDKTCPNFSLNIAILFGAFKDIINRF